MTDLSVELNSVSKKYGQVYAVNEVSLVMAPGECVILAGHNGAGKSTLVKLILGLIKPDAGNINVLGQSVASKAAAENRQYIGYLPEIVSLHPALTGKETMAFYASLKGLDSKPNLELLAKVGIVQVANKRVHAYSKGMRQRLALAQALLGRPKLLLLDEPTTGLDPASRLLFYDIVRELQSQGTSILLSSHALAEMEDLASRVIVMQKGSKIADGSMADLRANSKLPTRIIARFNRLPDPAPTGWQAINQHLLIAECLHENKLHALKTISSLPDLQDIEMLQPGLDEMYAHLLQREDV